MKANKIHFDRVKKTLYPQRKRVTLEQRKLIQDIELRTKLLDAWFDTWNKQFKT